MSVTAGWPRSSANTAIPLAANMATTPIFFQKQLIEGISLSGLR